MAPGTTAAATRARTTGALTCTEGQHPDLAAVVDWPPLLALAVEVLSPNVYINHSHLDVHPRDVPFEDVLEWAGLSPVRRQLLGDQTVDPFYWASGELPLDPRPRDLQKAA